MTAFATKSWRRSPSGSRSGACQRSIVRVNQGAAQGLRAGGADLAGIAARKQRKHPRPTHTGGPFAQATAAFHQRPLRLDRVGAVTCILAGTVTTVGTRQAFGALGGTDGGRLPRRHRPRTRDVPPAI